MGWEVWTVLCSMMFALQVQFNHWVQMPALVLSALRGVVSLLIAVPVLIFFGVMPPTEILLAVVAVAICGQTADIFLFHASAKYGGRLTSLFQPIKIWLIFVLWLIISVESRQSLLAEPLIFAAVVGCLLLSCFGLFYMRRHDASLAALPAVLPIAVAFTFGDIFVKLGTAEYSAWQFAFLLMVVQGLLALLIWPFSKHRWEVFTQRNLLFAPLMGTFHVGIVTVAITSLNLVPNPSYFTVIGMLSILWIYLGHRLFGQKEEANWLALLMLIAGAAGIVLLR